MPNVANSASIGPLVLRVQADGLFNANDVAQRIENMYLLEESTLRSVWGPTAYVPVPPGVDPDGRPEGHRPQSRTRPIVAGAPFTYSLDPTLKLLYGAYGFKQHGLFHAVMEGGRDILLLHTGTELWEFQGWERNWRRLLSDPASSHGLKDLLRDVAQADFPTQFEFVGNGIVIVPQDDRAYFYDGHAVAPLGFGQRPTSPTGRGPTSESKKYVDSDGGLNNAGYAHLSHLSAAMVDDRADQYTGLTVAPDIGNFGHMTNGFGLCRLGTPTTIPVTEPSSLASAGTGWIEQGEWRCAVQYVDKWGNLSPVSRLSNAITTDLHPAVVPIQTDDSGVVGEAGRTQHEPRLPTAVRLQIKWDDIPTGPDHCVGRRLYRTKDTLNTGDSTPYYLSQNSLSLTTEYATLPDNVVTSFPDNIPDGWLGDAAVELLPVPKFRLCCMALGRLWIGNIDGLPSTVRPSQAGFWGTFPAGNDLTPDPTSEITGMHSVPDGLLVCSKRTIFLVEASTDGLRFRYRPISSAIGCAAPNSMVTMPDGLVVWLSPDGFYAYDGTSAEYISPQLRRTFKRATYTRLKQAVAVYDPRSREYRCWVSLDGDSSNSTCFVFEGKGWRTRTDIVADSACVTKDHRQYSLVGGHIPGDANHSGVYLLDHDASPDIPEMDAVKNREALVETGWLEAGDSDKAKTSYVVYLWLRETESTSVTIEVLKNWREKVIETNTTKRYSEKDVPDFWGTTKLGSGRWRDKRPFWTRAAVHVPSAESVKFRIRGTGVWEFVGLQVEMAPRYYGGAQVTP